MKCLLLIALTLCFVVYKAHSISTPDVSSVNVGRRWYVGGSYNAVKNKDGSVLETENLSYYDGNEWKNISLAIDGDVYAVKVTTTLDVLIGGSFSSVDGLTTGPLAKYNYIAKKWESLIPDGENWTWGSNSRIYALAFDCTSLTLSFSSNRCNTYFGGSFTLNDGSTTITNVGRHSGQEDKLYNMGGSAEHGITGTVYALYQKGAGTEDSSKILWVGGDLQSNKANARFFAKFDDCRSSSPSFKGQGGDNFPTANGIVRGFSYQRTLFLFTTDKLVLSGDFDFTSSDGEKCHKQCGFNWKTEKFSEIVSSTTAFGSSAKIYSTGLQLTTTHSITAYFFGGDFTGATFQKLARVKSSNPTSVHDTQAALLNSHAGYIRSIDVCSSASKNCKAGSVAFVGTSGLVNMYDADQDQFVGFGQGFNSSSHVGYSVYSYAGASTATLKMGAMVVAIVAALFVM